MTFVYTGTVTTPPNLVGKPGDKREVTKDDLDKFKGYGYVKEQNVQSK